MWDSLGASSTLSRDGERVEAPSKSTQGSLCFTGGGGCGSNDKRSSLVTLRSLEEDSFKESAEKTNDEVGWVKLHWKMTHQNAQQLDLQEMWSLCLWSTTSALALHNIHCPKIVHKFPISHVSIGSAKDNPTRNTYEVIVRTLAYILQLCWQHTVETKWLKGPLTSSHSSHVWDGQAESCESTWTAATRDRARSRFEEGRLSLP